MFCHSRRNGKGFVSSLVADRLQAAGVGVGPLIDHALIRRDGVRGVTNDLVERSEPHHGVEALARVDSPAIVARQENTGV